MATHCSVATYVVDGRCASHSETVFVKISRTPSRRGELPHTTALPGIFWSKLLRHIAAPSLNDRVNGWRNRFQLSHPNLLFAKDLCRNTAIPMQAAQLGLARQLPKENTTVDGLRHLPLPPAANLAGPRGLECLVA